MKGAIGLGDAGGSLRWQSVRFPPDGRRCGFIYLVQGGDVTLGGARDGYGVEFEVALEIARASVW